MSVDDVAQLLEMGKLSKYVELFREKEIDGATLQELDIDAFEELGVKGIDRSKMIGIIKREKKQ